MKINKDIIAPVITAGLIEKYKHYSDRTPDVGLLEDCSKSVIVFAKHMLGIELYTWQKIIALDMMAAIHDETIDREFVVLTSRQIGKEQPLYSKILTPKGWKTMKDMKVNDIVIGMDGKPTTVTGVFPQGKKDIYRVTFTDGTSADCGLEHLWTVKSAGAKNWKTLTLKQIIKDRGMNPKSDNAYRIPLVEPIQMEEVKHKIDPYIMGALLGDASFVGSTPRISNGDSYIINKFKEQHTLTPITDVDYSILDIHAEIKRLNLYGTKSSSKFIPKEYLFDSKENRIKLLRGLMDTDGSIYGNCTMEYSTVSSQLKDDIKFLVESLGGNVRVKKRKSYYVKDNVRHECQDSYRVYVRIQDINPFELPRKANKFYNIKYKKHRIIKSIKLISNEEAQCIMVDNESHTYLTDNCIVTHNTKLASIMAMWVSIFNKLPSGDGNNSDVGVISAGDRQAKLVLREIKINIRLGDRYCKEHYSKEKGDLMDRGFFSELLGDDDNATTLSFKEQEFTRNEEGGLEPKLHPKLLADSKIGTSINSYPPTASVLGQTFAYLHEDEAGKTDKFTDDAHNDYLSPTGDARNAIRLYTSTAWTTSGFFYKLCDPDNTKEEHTYNRYVFTVDAISIENPKQREVVQGRINKMLLDDGIDAVNRAYYCRFVKGESSYFDPKDIDKVFDDPNLMKVESYAGLCDIGVDFGGQVKSRTVITVTRLTEEGVIERLYDKVYEVGKDNNIIVDLEEIMKAFPGWQRIIPDDCAQGDYLIREMYDKGWNVQPMNFRTWKVKKYGSLRAKVKRGLVKSYPDSELKIEMKALEFSNTSKQSNIRAPPGYNDDRTDSFLMSAFFFLNEEEVKFAGLDINDGDENECRWL